MTTSGRTPAPLVWSGRFLVGFALLMVANALVTGMREGTSAAVDLSFAVLLALVAAGIARGLRRSSRGAWIAAVLLSVGALFFVAPIMGTMLLGGGLTPVGTGWDIAYFPLMTGCLVAALVALGRGRAHVEPRSTNADG